MSNYKYLVTYGKLLYDKNDFLPFLVETTAPISTALHFTVLKNRVVAAHTHRPDDFIPVSVSRRIDLPRAATLSEQYLPPPMVVAAIGLWFGSTPARK